MPLVPKLSVIPPGGYHFPDRSTGEVVKIEAGSFGELEAAVLKHRLSNGYPPGNPALEVSEYICGSWPHFCRDSERAEAAPRSSPAVQARQGLATRCAAWLARFYVRARVDKGVAPNVTQHRAETCVRCPKNQEFRGGCGSCLENIQRIFFVWRRDRPLPLEAELKACEVTGQHNGAAALSAYQPELTQEERDALPAGCWRKTL